MGPNSPYGRLAIITGIASALLAACGTAVMSPSPLDPTVALRQAESRFADAFNQGYAHANDGRARGDFSAALAGTREMRLAFDGFDTSLRSISFPASAEPDARGLVSAENTAVRALDDQLTATTFTSYTARDLVARDALLAFQAANASLERDLGISLGTPPPTPRGAT